MEDALVRVVDLCKVYNPGENEVRALDHVNLEIYQRGNLWLLSDSPVPENPPL